MKKIILLFTTASLFFAAGCSKENNIKDDLKKLNKKPADEFFIEARINNETDFKATGIYCSFVETAGGIINVQGMKPDQSELITLTFAPYAGVGEYPIVKIDNKPFAVCQYKGRGANYSTIHSKIGIAKITSYDKEKGIIEGDFSFRGVDIQTQKKALLIVGEFRCKRIKT